MMRNFHSLLFCLCFLLVAGPLGAEPVQRLYEAEIVVPDQGVKARATALRLAMERVLVKVSGNGAVAGEPALTAALEQPSRYVQQFRYRRQAPPQELGTGPADQGVISQRAEYQLLLWARFDSDAINRLLRDNSLPVWGGARPMTLLWLALEENGSRRLLGSNEPGMAARSLLNRARARGVPVHLPLLDLQDNSRLRPADVWGSFRETILGASARYQPEAVLVGRVFWAPAGYWRALWTLYLGEESLHWDSAGQLLDAVLAVGIDGTADTLSQRFSQSVMTAAQPDLSLEVRDVSALDAYARARDYLAGLDGVRAVRVVGVTASSVTYRLSLEGSVYNMTRAISLGDTLAAVEQESVGAAPAEQGEAVSQPIGRAAEFIYRLLP